MLRISLKILQMIEERGFEAYIVGGFVRDYLLGITSNDVDITTNATPKDIKEIFADACLPNDDYGSVKVIYKNIHFEITTYRKEEVYKDNRRPSQVIYINNLIEDLSRRDFTINTICMNSQEEIIDHFEGRKDLAARVIKTVGDPLDKFKEDVLRILRAIRFATTLDFTIEPKTKDAILETKFLLENLSMNRKKEELDRIFSCAHALEGIELLYELQLEEALYLPAKKTFHPCSQMIGIWLQLEVDNIYPFTRNEKKMMEDIRSCMKKGPLNSYVLYEYGLYICTVAGELLDIDKKKIAHSYQSLAIHKRSDLEITAGDIITTLDLSSKSILRTIYRRLEEDVLGGKVVNNKESLLKACEKYLMTQK